MTTEQEINFEELSELEFAKVFSYIHKQILKDPITYFIKAKGLMNFTPTPAQTVALKLIFGKPLDKVTLHKVWMECEDSSGSFDLEEKEMTEEDLYEFMTGRMYLS